MSIRRNRVLGDIRDVLVDLLESKTTSPWNRWQIIAGYPNETVFERFLKPFIFVNSPVDRTPVKHQGSGSFNYIFNIPVGCWVNINNGWENELSIMTSELLLLFDNRKTCNSLIFDTKTDTTYDNTTLVTMKMPVIDFSLGRYIPYPDDKQLRQDSVITVKTNFST
jgi:hypothetical protein